MNTNDWKLEDWIDLYDDLESEGHLSIEGEEFNEDMKKRLSKKENSE